MKKRFALLPVCLFVLIGAGLLFVSSCNKGQHDLVGNNDPGGYDDRSYALAGDYFPMKLGNTWYYSVYKAVGTDTSFNYHLEARIDSSFGRTNYYRMSDSTRTGYMFWGSTRSSEIRAGGGTLFHTRLIDSSTTYQEITKRDTHHDQAFIGGLFDVTTPAGTFSCIRNEHRYFQNDSIHLVRYFAKHRGLVWEEQYKIVGGINYPIYIQVLDSTSFP